MTSLHWPGRWWLKEHAHRQGPVWFPLSPGQCTLYVEGYPPVCKMSFSWTWAAHWTGQGQLHAPQYWLFPPFLALGTLTSLNVSCLSPGLKHLVSVPPPLRPAARGHPGARPPARLLQAVFVHLFYNVFLCSRGKPSKNPHLFP